MYKYKIEDIENKILCGDVFQELQKFPSNVIDMIITSPPYFNQRSYLPETDKNKKFEIGLEDNPQEYIDKIVSVCLECVRVLKNTGVFFLNIGDFFYNSSIKHKTNWLKEKGKLLLPMRIAIALQDKGVLIRDTIIYVKKLTKYPEKVSIGTTLPASTKDKFLPAFEYIFQIVKSKNYYFNLEPLKTEIKRSPIIRTKYPIVETYSENSSYKKSMSGVEKFRRKYSSAFEGDSWNLTLKNPIFRANPTNVVMFKPNNQFTNNKEHYAQFPETLVEFFIIVGCPEKGIVLDPFLGSGTTAIVAKKLGRKFIGIELYEKYCKAAVEKVENIPESMF